MNHDTQVNSKTTTILFHSIDEGGKRGKRNDYKNKINKKYFNNDEYHEWQWNKNKNIIKKWKEKVSDDNSITPPPSPQSNYNYFITQGMMLDCLVAAVACSTSCSK